MTNSPSQRRSRALTVRNDLSPFGNKLVQAGYTDSNQMRQALIESRKAGAKSLVEILESMTGKQLPAELLRQYKKQQLFELKILYGIEYLDPEINAIPTDQVSELIKTLIPLEVCRRYRLVPLSRNDSSDPPSALVAMVDPDNLDAQDDLNRILRQQGLVLQRRVITAEDFRQIIDKFLDEQVAEQQATAAGKKKREFREVSNEDLRIDEFEGELQAAEDDGDGDVDLSDVIASSEAAPVIKTVDKILVRALTDGVSDIHVEPQENCLRVRFRKDGVLQEPIDPLPKKVIPAIVSRFKIIAELDIAERRAAQDGRIRRTFQGRKVDFRVNTVPSRYGEKICLRILDNSSTQLGLDKLISNPDTLAIVRDMSSRPFGLILVVGPTGSGKSTTLYSMLAERNDPGVNICTAEDPIEYALPGINQVQVIREKGMNFAQILRAFMRQDPDIILVGETRDLETAKTAIEASLTGHLVLTTLHANDAAGAVARLDEMGVEPFMVTGALIGVIAQRLMRRVCTECRVPYTPSDLDFARFGLSKTAEKDTVFYKANTLIPEEIQAARSQGTLCPKCSGVGYKGRCGVYEVMRGTERLLGAITEGAPTERLKEIAVEDGMLTLLSYSLNLVREGATTLEEVERVTYTDTGLEAELKAKRKTSLTCRTCGAALCPEWSECIYCMTPRFQD